MSRVLTEPPKGRVTRVREVTVAVVVVLVVVAGSAVGAWMTRDPEFVERIEVRNPTDYQVAVRVGSGDDRWLSLATIPPGQTRVTYSVLDQGARWRFEFRVAGDRFGGLDLSKEELESSGWSIDVR